jgi:transposase
MTNIVEYIDENLEYESHYAGEKSIEIYVKSKRTKLECPFCGEISQKVHSVYARKFQHLPIDGKKVKIIIKNKKYFCLNPECSNTTFAETFECLPYNARRSKRLTDEIIQASAKTSSVKASALLRKNTADVGKSTICEILKKKKSKDFLSQNQ